MRGICLILSMLAVHVSSCDIFPCGEKNTIVIIGDSKLNCPTGTFCNPLGKENCKPCVDNPCDFKCIDKDTVEIQDVKMTCQKNYFCDTTNNAECIPCQPGKCEPEIKNFECIDEKTVKLEGMMTVECQEKLVCNENFTAPCTPCIESSSPVNEKPCTADRMSNCFPGHEGQYYRCKSFWNGTIESQLRNCSEIQFDAKCFKSGVC